MVLWSWLALFLICYPAFGKDDFFGYENAKSKDTAIVLLNDRNTDLVAGFSAFAGRNMLQSHYAEENIIFLRREELDACKELIQRKADFRCKHLTGEACKTDPLPL